MTASKYVYLVMAGTHYEGDSVVSVHRTEEGANRESARLARAAERIRKKQAALLADEERYAKEDWPAWPDDVPNCDTIYVSCESLKR